MEIKDVCPTDPPKELPPDRGSGDVHNVEVEPGSKIQLKPPYKQSPAEKLLIK